MVRARALGSLCCCFCHDRRLGGENLFACRRRAHHVEENLFACRRRAHHVEENLSACRRRAHHVEETHLSACRRRAHLHAEETHLSACRRRAHHVEENLSACRRRAHLHVEGTHLSARRLDRRAEETFCAPRRGAVTCGGPRHVGGAARAQPRVCPPR
eukprot:g15759.t1